MAKGTLKISKQGVTYIPEGLRKDGFKGHVDYLANAKTVTLMRPGATLEEIEKSLRIILQDIKLRKGDGNNEQR